MNLRYKGLENNKSKIRRIFCARRRAEIDDSGAIRNFGDEVWCKINEYTGLLFSWKSLKQYAKNVIL
jgi:hypothetical protein